MEAVLQGIRREKPLIVGTMEVAGRGSFTVFSINDDGNYLKAYVNSTEYTPFAEGLLEAGMQFLRLARKRTETEEAEKCQDENPASSS